MRPDQEAEAGELILARVNLLDPSEKSVLLSLGQLPSSPNTISESAALSITGGSMGQLRKLAACGLLEQVSLGRCAVPPIVAKALPQQADDPTRSRIASYFAQFAHIYQTDLTAIDREYLNLMCALEVATIPGESAQIIFALSRVLEFRGEYQRWKGLLESILLQQMLAPQIQANLLCHLSRAQLKSGEFSSAAASAERALALGLDERMESILLTSLGHAKLDAADIHAAGQYLTRSLALALLAEDVGAAIHARVILGVVLTRTARYPEAESCTLEGLRDARQVDDLAAVASLLTNLGVVYFNQQRYGDAISAYDEGLAVARQVGFREKEAALLHVKGETLIEQGRAAEAEPLIEEALSIAQEVGHAWYIARILTERGLARLALGNIEGSLQDFYAVLGSTPAGARDIEAFARFGIAQAMAAKGSPDSALENARESLAILQQIGHHVSKKVQNWLAVH